jgi:hypothetical protein
MVAMELLALSSRLQPGEHCLHYSHRGRESIHIVLHVSACGLSALSMPWAR